MSLSFHIRDPWSTELNAIRLIICKKIPVAISGGVLGKPFKGKIETLNCSLGCSLNCSLNEICRTLMAVFATNKNQDFLSQNTANLLGGF